MYNIVSRAFIDLDTWTRSTHLQPYLPVILRNQSQTNRLVMALTPNIQYIVASYQDFAENSSTRAIHKLFRIRQLSQLKLPILLK